MARLRRYKTLLRDVGKRRHSTKRRRELLMSQVERRLWTGFKEACQCVLPLQKPPPPPAGGQRVVMEEMIVLPKKELPEIV